MVRKVKVLKFIHSIAECGKCKAETKRLNLNKFCKRDYGNFNINSFYFSHINIFGMLKTHYSAIMAKIIDRNTPSETSNPTKEPPLTKFIISVQTIFKKSSGGILGNASRRTPITLVIPTKDLECRCPKLKTNK